MISCWEVHQVPPVGLCGNGPVTWPPSPKFSLNLNESDQQLVTVENEVRGTRSQLLFPVKCQTEQLIRFPFNFHVQTNVGGCRSKLIDVWLRPERGDAAAADRTNRGVSSKKTPAAAPASVHFHNFRLKWLPMFTLNIASLKRLN